MATPLQMTPSELGRRLRAAGAPTVLDVREPHEIALARFPRAIEIPMNDVPARLGEIPRDGELVVLCHHGGRSAQVASFLLEQGFARVANLVGGIDAWSLQIDSGVPRY